MCMARKTSKIKYQVEFRLDDFDKFRNSYPNFRYNYSTFREWAEATMDYMLASCNDLEGMELTVKKVS